MPRLALSTRPSLLAFRPQRHQWPSTSTASAPRRQFHASAPRHDGAAEMQNHYETLELPMTATAAEIKRQFYSLSKRHHPDRNKGDPASSSRFVRISEAYHVLGSPEKRGRYDRDLSRTLGRSAHHSHHHSAHAYAGPAGSRPASGLSRRRTQFRGPPPSFYRNGAWGAHSAKRAANAPGSTSSSSSSSSSSSHPSSDDDNTYTGGFRFDESSSGSAYAGGDNTYTGAFYSGGGGFGPGQAERGWDGGVPHWDARAHSRTQEGIAARFNRRARSQGLSSEEMQNGGGAWSLLVNFVVVSSAIAVVASIPSFINNKKKEKAKAQA